VQCSEGTAALSFLAGEVARHVSLFLCVRCMSREERRKIRLSVIRIHCSLAGGCGRAGRVAISKFYSDVCKTRQIHFHKIFQLFYFEL